jgi:hypothetical protein
MQHTIPAAFFTLSGAALSMSEAGLSMLVIGLLAARNNIAQARGIDKIVALTPSYMPWRMFWVYFVGFALVGASLSIATMRLVQWSGLLLGP